MRATVISMLIVCVACGGVEKPSADPQASPAETQAGGEAETALRVGVPAADAVVASPLVVSGEARGSWFFEATFPVTLLDGDGNVLVRSYAQAQGEWMTEQPVPFTAELVFAAPATATAGILVLEKANPSGLPEHADEVRVPVRLAARSAP